LDIALIMFALNSKNIMLSNKFREMKLNEKYCKPVDIHAGGMRKAFEKLCNVATFTKESNIGPYYTFLLVFVAKITGKRSNKIISGARFYV
uniref:Rad21_Rec8 domain-containing protein n=1 Tax=Brugia timori TaxID=42155 RepID=A0A0R3R306_9BILA